MGWKASVILVADEAGYFGSRPVHDPEQAERLRVQLGLEAAGFCDPSTGVSTFDRAMYPAARALHIGAYPRGFIVCHRNLAACLFDEAPARRIAGSAAVNAAFRARLLALRPGAEVLALELHSVVNLWGYALHRQGRLLRAAAGSSDDGVMVDQGASLAEEAALLGGRSLTEACDEGLDEDLVFAVAARLLGTRLDDFEAGDLQLSEYAAASLPRSLWCRWFGRA